MIDSERVKHRHDFPLQRLQRDDHCRSIFKFSIESLEDLEPDHDDVWLPTQVQRASSLPAQACPVYPQRQACSNRQDPLGGQRSWSSRCCFFFSGAGDFNADVRSLDFEANLLRLLEKVTNGTVIEISYTGALCVFSLGHQTLQQNCP